MRTSFKDTPPFLGLQTELPTGTRYAFDPGIHRIDTAHVELILPDADCEQYSIQAELGDAVFTERIQFFHTLADRFEKLRSGLGAQAYALLVDIAEGGFRYHHQNDPHCETDSSDSVVDCRLQIPSGDRDAVPGVISFNPYQNLNQHQYVHYSLPVSSDGRFIIELLSSGRMLDDEDFRRLFANVFNTGRRFRKEALEEKEQ